MRDEVTWDVQCGDRLDLSTSFRSLHGCPEPVQFLFYVSDPDAKGYGLYLCLDHSQARNACGRQPTTHVRGADHSNDEDDTRWWGRVLRPDRATEEEILMVEVMVHGIASLGVPR